ncbi:MAG: lipocalin family protein [Rikenellaceae bacterium]
MKKLFLSFVAIFCFVCANAQNNKALIGEWKSVVESKLEKWENSTGEDISRIDTSVLIFNSNGTFKYQNTRVEDGVINKDYSAIREGKYTVTANDIFISYDNSDKRDIIQYKLSGRDLSICSGFDNWVVYRRNK